MANKARVKKSPEEQLVYRTIVKNAPEQEDTISILNPNLCGSDQSFEDDTIDDEKVKVSLFYRLKKRIKEHVFESVIAIITSIIIAVVGWNISLLIDLKVDVAVIENELLNLEKQLDAIDADTLTKDVISLQIESAKKELNNSIVVETSELKVQLELIKQQIEYIENGNRLL